MELIQSMFKAVYDVLNVQIDLLGYQITFRHIFIFVLIASMVITFILELRR